MVRLFKVYFPVRTLVLAFSEALLIVASMATVIFAKLGSDAGSLFVYEKAYTKIAILTAVGILCMYYNDLYDSLVLSNWREAMARLIQALGALCLVMAFLYYAYPSSRLEQDILLPGIFVLAGLLALDRIAFLAANRIPRFAERAILLGDGALAPLLAAEVNKRPELGICLLGYVTATRTAQGGIHGLPCLGELENFVPLVQDEKIKRIIIALDDRRGRLPLESLLQLKAEGIRVEDGTDVYETVTGRVPLISLRPSWILFSRGFRISRGVLIYKRAFSLVFSTLTLLLSLPVMVLISLAIWLESPGPIIFRQKRIGKAGKVFVLYKFRSMREGANREGSQVPARENDERFTRVGRWIRRLRLDELPQLYNILRGDMYFVGPRPFVPEQEELCLREIPFYAQRLTIKPGATGWAQVNRGYCATLEDNVEKLQYDLFYIKNLSMGLDLFIIFRTIKILVLGRGGR